MRLVFQRRTWCLATFGMPWPKDVGQILKYFEAVKSWTGDLEQGVKPKKVAPMYTVATLLAAEHLVCRKDLLIRLRFYGFVFLLMSWACLRCDEISRGALENGTISTPADLDHLLRCLAMDRW